MSIYPFEDDIEKLVQKHFGLHWSFKVARSLPDDKHSQALMAIRKLVYDAVQDSYTRGRQDEKNGVKQYV